MNTRKTKYETDKATQLKDFVMEVKFIHHPENDICKKTIGESILYEIRSPFIPSKPFSRFFLNCYKCGMVANLGDHDAVDVQDGIVTISPSILCPRDTCKEHYFIKDGIVA